MKKYDVSISRARTINNEITIPGAFTVSCPDDWDVAKIEEAIDHIVGVDSCDESDDIVGMVVDSHDESDNKVTIRHINIEDDEFDVCDKYDPE